MIWIGLMVLVLIVLVVTGQFHIDNKDYPEKFGIYYSALRGLPAYYNPLWQSILALQGIALVLLSALLFLFRKKLKLPALPWLLTIVITMIGIVAFRPVLNRAYPFDDTVSSTIKWFVYMELIAIAATLLGHWISSRFQKQRTGNIH